MSDQLDLWTIPPPAPDGALERGLEGSALAARKWTPLEMMQVTLAIRQCVADLEEFTADDVWAALPDGFPVTKGLAGRLMVARYEGRIAATGRIAARGRARTRATARRLALDPRMSPREWLSVAIVHAGGTIMGLAIGHAWIVGWALRLKPGELRRRP